MTILVRSKSTVESSKDVVNFVDYPSDNEIASINTNSLVVVANGAKSGLYRKSENGLVSAISEPVGISNYTAVSLEKESGIPFYTFPVSENRILGFVNPVVIVHLNDDTTIEVTGVDISTDNAGNRKVIFSSSDHSALVSLGANKITFSVLVANY